jgi:hypothetical protein
MEIILVCLENFQEYILDNIDNLLLFKNNNITVITNKKFNDKFAKYNVKIINCEDLDDMSFNKKSQLDKQFRGGFWHLCSLRFYYIYSYIKQYNIQNCIHIENDVMIYYNLDNKLFTSDKICCVFDSYTRVIPSIIFIPSPEKFKIIIDNYCTHINDMANLARFDETIIERLPLFTYLDINDEYKMITKNYSKYNIIFDGASIGQYLGGVDGCNISGDTRGFINETCIVKYNNYNFYWILDNNLYIPHIKINNKLFPIFNLHIHSKKLFNFKADNPLEDKFIKFI